jgi:hypothetical protein
MDFNYLSINSRFIRADIFLCVHKVLVYLQGQYFRYITDTHTHTVGIVIRLRPGRSVVCILAWARECSLLLKVQTVSGDNSAPFQRALEFFVSKVAGA